MLPESSFPWDYDNERLGLTYPDGVVGRDSEAITGVKNGKREVVW